MWRYCSNTVVCSACNIAASKKNGEELEKWQNNPDKEYSENYQGTAGNMQDGVCSELLRTVRGITLSPVFGYLRDGDSKAFSTIANADPPIYMGKKVQKYECFGRVQRWVGG